MEQLFKKTIPLKLKTNDRDERQVSIGVTIMLNTVSSPVHKKELVIRLTDETDPFFLYTLALGEEDFQGLKVQQGLLVDFGAFPQKLIDLLDLCLSETGKENPKFLLQFCESSSPSISILHVVETNPFRHLNHLSLQFVPAGDTYLKKYLAECLLQLKEENASLSHHLTSTKTDLSAQLAQCEETLNNRTQELERLKSDWSSHAATLTSEHCSSLNAEREKLLQAKVEAQAQFELEKRALEQTHLDKLGSVEGRLQELDLANKELTDYKYRSEAAIRELEAKLKTAEEECSGMREELQRLRKENAALDASTHTQDKSLSQLRTRVAVLEQELQDKEQVIGRTAELLEASQEQKKAYKDGLEKKKVQIIQLEKAFKSTSQEVLKGNEIIQKLQVEIRKSKSKLKLRNMVTTQQEDLLGEKDRNIVKLKQEIDSLKHSLSLKEEELSKRETVLEEMKGKFDEAQEQLKTNENVISWLNKQMTEQMLGHGGHNLSSILPPRAGILSTIKSSSSSLLPHYTTSSTANSYAGIMATLQNKPQFSSTPTAGTNTSSSSQILLHHTSLPVQLPRSVKVPLSSQENVIGRQQVLFKGGKKTLPSPLSEQAYVANKGVVVGGGAPPSNEKGSAVVNEPWLDPKYLPPDLPNDDEQGIPNSYASITPGVMKPQGVLKNGGGGFRGKSTAQLGNKGAVSGHLKPATLASSYFPKS